VPTSPSETRLSLDLPEMLTTQTITCLSKHCKKFLLGLTPNDDLKNVMQFSKGIEDKKTAEHLP